MVTSEYRTNRPHFPADELARYQGQWVAFSPDGRHIVAAAETMGQLEDQLAAAGHDPQQVVLEGIPGPEDVSLGGAELLS